MIRLLTVGTSYCAAIFATKGNEDCHIILRGGRKPNFDETNVKSTEEELVKANLVPHLMIDFSHANNHKDYRRQSEVAVVVAGQIAAGSRAILGVMIESHLVEGSQRIDGKKREELVYGQSITDGCIGFDTTEKIASTC